MQAGGSEVCDFGFPDPGGTHGHWSQQDRLAGWVLNSQGWGGLEPTISHPAS